MSKIIFLHCGIVVLFDCYHFRDADAKMEIKDDLGWKAKLKIPAKDHRIQTTVSTKITKTAF